MQRRRPVPVADAHTQDLARRFLQLDTDIRLAAAAGGLLPFLQSDRPESPAQQYDWDGHLQHPKPKPANGPIEIRQLENVAKTKPTIKGRSHSDPGDAHRLIARFVRSNEEKTRSMTVSATGPSNSPPPTLPSVVNSTRGSQSERVFPFPSMKRQTTLENFIEMESSANETGREDPLALKMGQILARRAAAATRSISRRRSPAGSRSGGSSRAASVLPEARPRPAPLDVSDSAGRGHAKRESVVIDDRSPHEGQFWRTVVPDSSRAGPSTDVGRPRTPSFSESRVSLQSFVFPAPSSPVQARVQVQIQSPVGARAQVQIQSPVRAQFQVQTQPSPVRSQFQQSPVRSQFQQSPVRAQFQVDSPVRTRAQIQVQTQLRPMSFGMDASPGSGVYVSPVESVNWGAGFLDSPTAYRPSPPLYRASPSVHGSDAHVNLLRGLSPLPSHGLPLPAPIRPHPLNLLNNASRFSVHLSRENVRVPSPLRTPPTVATPAPIKTPSPPMMTSSPPRVPSPRALERTPIVPAPSPAQVASPSPLPTQASSPYPPAPHAFPTYSPDVVPSRALSPLPPRLRHHTNASHPSDGSGSDEVVFRGSSSSASSSPAKRRRGRVRPHLRVNSDGFVRRTMSEGVRSKRASDGGHVRSARTSEVRRTAQSMMRRTQTGDGGEVSSDGRDVVLFVPRGPPPPVPKVPTPPVTVVEPARGPAAPPLVRRESIPLPQASPNPGAAELGPPSAVKTEPKLQAKKSDTLMVPTRNTSTESLRKPIIGPPARHPPLAYMPWSPPRRVLSRPEMTSREGSFHTAPDSFVEDLGMDTDAEFPSSVPGSFPDQSYMEDRDSAKFEGGERYVVTPVHMDLSELDEEESPTMFSAEDDTTIAQDVPERAMISSAMRGHVSQPAILARRPSGEFVRVPSAVPSPPRSVTPARRSVLSGVFQQGFLVPPSLAPSPLASSRSGSSHTHSGSQKGGGRAHTASIPMRHDDYSPPRYEQLPRSVTPRTEASVRHPEEDSFNSAHTADDILRLPLHDWIQLAMSSMAAMGIPLTRTTLEDLHESEDEGVAAVAEALSTSSMRGFQVDEDGVGILDGISQADEDSGDSLSRSWSDISETTSPSHGSEHSVLFSGPGFAGMTTFSTAPPESTGTRPTILTTDLGYSTDNAPNPSAISRMTIESESESERAVESLQNIAVVVREMNRHTPIPSTSSSRVPPSSSTSTPMHTPFSAPWSHAGPPSFVGPPPIPGSYQSSTPARALSPGSVSITFREASPALSTAPPLVVLPGDRDRFADSLLIAEYQHRHSFQYLRDDEYRALDEGGDVVLYGAGEEWEHVESRRIRTESHGTTDSGVPIEFPDHEPDGTDIQARNKYMQFLLSFTSALRPPGTNRPPRWTEVALRTLRSQGHGTRPRYPSSLYDAISRTEAGLEDPPQAHVPGHLSSTFVSSSPSPSSSSKSTSIGSALPEDDEILEEFVQSVLMPRTPTPAQLEIPIQSDAPNAIPWPVLASPVAPRFPIARPASRQTARTYITSTTSSGSAYSSLIPPLPRPRSRSVEPHWMAVYMTRRWPMPHTYVTRRTYSSPSALGPPMPYHWRPICHISPERLWEITNLAVRVDMPPPPPPALSIVESASPVDYIRPHYTTPATTHGRATPYSARTGSSRRSRQIQTPTPPPVPAPIYPVTERMTSHPNLPINPSPHLLPLQATASRTSIPLVQRPLDRQYTTRTSTSSARPSHTAVASRAMTPAGPQRKRTVRNLVGRLIGKERARTMSRTGSPLPLVGKSRFGFAGRVVDVARRVWRHPRRRTRVSSIRSQRTREA